MKGKKYGYKAKRGIATILASIFLINIVALSLLLIVTYENYQANDTIKTVQSLQKEAQQPLLYEAWDKGNTVLRAFQPLMITHIILPNGEVENTSLLLQNQMPINQILNGFPWAIVVTQSGTWYNITPIQLPGVIWDLANPSNVSGLPWWYQVLDVNTTPCWFALMGLKALNQTKTPLPDPVTVNGVGFNEGYTDKLVVFYPNSTNYWVNITYYASPCYVSMVENPYYQLWIDGATNNWAYLKNYLNVWKQSEFYLMLTTDPYVGYWSPLYYSAQYYEYGNYHAPILPVQPQGGSYFNYTFVNATIGVYFPTNGYDIENPHPQYVYVYFSDIEITNASAFIPAYNSTTQEVSLTNGTWDESSFSWIATPSYASPVNVMILHAYSNPTETFKIYSYPNNQSYTYAPMYEAFPAINYSNFPSYFGYYYFPAYNFTVQKMAHTGYVPYGQFIPSWINYANDQLPYPFISGGGTSDATYIPGHYDPIEVFKLAINLKDGVMLNYIYSNGVWLLVYQGNFYYPLNPLYNLPVYITIPQGVYLLAIG